MCTSFITQHVIPQESPDIRVPHQQQLFDVWLTLQFPHIIPITHTKPHVNGEAL